MISSGYNSLVPGIVTKIASGVMRVLAAACSGMLLAPLAVLAYRDGPPPDRMGGFGGQTCHSCHNDHPLNDASGKLLLEGVPAAYRPGGTYRVTVRLERPGLFAAGFQIAARDAEGRPAGEWRIADPSVQLIDSRAAEGLRLVQQTLAGSTFENQAAWTFEWIAPESGKGAATFSVAANASNDDASALGDYIYTTERVSGSE